MAQTRQRSPSVIIIGSGFGGLGMAIQLKRAGFHDLTILERATDIGGTWRDNTYPGAACDVQSHLYSYSFEPKYDWSRKFAGQAEILNYMRHCVTRYGLAGHLHFNRPVRMAVFDDQKNQWTVSTESGHSYQADILITATGQLNRPATPKIAGLETFKGACFHSARWQHDCDLRGKRVAVIGTGASAIQLVPEIVSQVQTLDLYQRSAAWVLPKPDRPFSPREQALFRSVPGWDRLYRSLIYWKNESRALAFTRFSWILNAFARQARQEAEKRVTDPDKRARIVPDYRIGCKRILISNDWYPAINQPHLALLTDAIERVEKDAIVSATGERRPTDVIILATGFKASEFLAPMEIRGLGSVTLNDAWAEGSQAYKGISVSGFPNLFMLYGPNTNLAHNSIIYMLESQFRYVVSAVDALARYPGAAMDVRQEQQTRFCRTLHTKLDSTVWDSGCTSWYLDEHGRNTINWPGFTFNYRFATRAVDTADYRFTGAAAS